MCQNCEIEKLIARAKAQLADIEGGYELKRAALARLVRDMTDMVEGQHRLLETVAFVAGREPKEVALVPRSSLQAGGRT